MINFIKGILVGIFNIIPGLSGSALLIILDLYEKCLNAIGNTFKNPKQSFLFLFPIGLGILLGTYIFSNIIFFFLNKWPMEIYIVFTFFILGTIPHLYKEAIKKGFNKKYIIPFFITFSLGIILLFIDKNNLSYSINYNLISIIKYFSIGIILSLSTIIPGISSTILLSLVNLYGIYIYSISSLNIYILIPILIGFSLTTFLIAKLITYLINKYYGYTYFAILGFVISTIPCLLNNKIIINTNLIISIIIGIIAFIITYYSFKVIK